MADSDIVIWFAEHHCFGDVLVARRQVAGWKVAEAHRWLRVALVTGHNGLLHKHAGHVCVTLPS